MSYTWGAIKKEKLPKTSGAVMMGVIVTAFIGIPLLLISNHYELNIPTYLGVLFIIIVFPSVTIFTYKSSNKTSKK